MIVLGRLVAPYGVKGWMHLHAFGDDPASWAKMAEWRLGLSAEGDQWQVFHPEAVRLHGDSWVVKLMGVEDRNGAEALIGRYLAAPRELMPAAGDGEYYWADLIGLAVVNGEGVGLGTVQSLIETGANDVLVVRDGEVERLLPFVDAVVRKVDVPAGRIEVEWGADW